MEDREEQAKALPQHTVRLAHGWLQVKIPLPFSLRSVNSYMVKEAEGYTVIDPGLRTEEGLEVWEKVLAEEGIEWTDVKRVIVTHQHPDHYGLAGYFQQRSGAPVFISMQSHRYTQELWGEAGSFAEELGQLFAEHGMPPELVAAVDEHLDSFIPKVLPHPAVTYMEAGQRLVIDGCEWELIDAPGHAWGQLVLFNASSGWMLCGDQVLPRITPNVSYVPRGEADPLASFMDSLKHLGAYPVTYALPGHRDPFTDFAGRTQELLRHHERRLAQIRETLAEQPLTAFELCELLFGKSLRHNAHNLRFAMSETLAHLIYLERRELIRSCVEAGRVVYS